MIKRTYDIDSATLDKLKQNHYTRRIKSHFQAYGTKYDFLQFFSLSRDGSDTGLICVFNSAMLISTFQDTDADEQTAEEIAAFINLNKPYSVELEQVLAKQVIR